MGEIKSVKVDNWGVFFLQKLQNFFNKTDYCDLTLQFRDNSQLKVHRLVLSACTDYFNVLEQTCEVIDDALIMPIELQADVVVPIVNFMYTGTLEFELKMYGKLLRTAKEMNMTVLLKLLEAHRRTMEGVNRAQRPPSPKPIRRRGPGPVATAAQQQQQRRVLASANVSPQRRLVQTKTIATGAPQPQFRQQIGSTSLLRTSAVGSGTSPIKIQFGATSTQYETQQQQEFKHEPEDFEPSSTMIQQPPSPFEQLRKGYNNNKRPASATFISPPAKKPNIEDVKEFAEQQRMRKQIAAEYGDDQEYEGMLDDDIHNDDDDDDAAVIASSSTATRPATTTSRQQVHQSSATITFKQEQNDKPPTIVVKDSSNSKMNHAKIISEVLRQYPHLVKSNKNIKLKIMPNVGGQPQKIIVKKEQLDTIASEISGGGVQQQQPQKVAINKPPQVSSQTLLKPIEKAPPPQPALAKLPLPQKQSSMGAATAIADNTPTAVSSTATATTSSAAPVQKRRIDSKTMHALIAMGAENTTGPWLCLRCGVNGRPISIPSYRGFRRHLINTHKEAIDSALCEHCGWRSSNNRTLHYHMQIDHKVKTTLYTFPGCLMCSEQFLDTDALNQHMVTSHPDENKQQCIYCNKIFAKESQLYTHTKLYHKKQALEDGIIDYSDEEFVGSPDVPMQNVAGEKKESKIKILSDISLPSASSLIKLEPSSEAASLSTIASGIAASIGIASAEDFMAHSSEAADEPKFVNADGNEMQLTEEQRKEIISQLNQDHHDGGMVMVINEQVFPATESSQAVAVAPNEESESETLGELEDATAAMAEEEEEEVDDAAGAAEEDFDDSQIYSEFTKQSSATVAEAKKATPSALDESKESIDNLEWAENLISAHEMEDEAVDADTEAEQQKAKKDDDISKKLKELTGDWSDDENDDDGEVETTTAAAEEVEAEPEDVHEDEEEDLVIKPTEQAADSVNVDPENTEKSPDDDPTTETATTENEPAIGEESKIMEDDIDLAIKSLHKDDIITENEPTDVEAHSAEEAPVAPNVDEEEVSQESTVVAAAAEVKEAESMIVDEEHATDEAVDKHEQLHAPLEGKPIEENILQTEDDENIVEENVEKADDNDNEEPAVESVDRKTLLEDLIAETDIVKDEPEEGDEMEFLKIATKLPLPEKEQAIIVSESAEVATLEPTESAELESAEETPLTSSEAASAALESIEATDSTVDEPMETIEAEAVATTTVTSTSAAVTSKDAEVEIATPAPASKTEDKVKSLISEWADDDDDAEEEL